MLFWIIIAVLALTPLILHLRGGSIVTLSLSVAAIYGAVFLILRVLFQLLESNVRIAHRLIPASPTDTTTFHDTFFETPNLSALLIIAACFGGIALIFWTLGRWNAPLPHDLLKTLFWLLHISILALPLAMYVFFSAGIFDSYAGGPNDLPVFAMSSAIISILCVIAIGGFVIAALGAVVKRLRA